MSNPIPIVLDTDVGADPDDALALLLALASPEVDLLGVTVVDGDVGLRARIASRLLGMAGRPDVPVVEGLPRPVGPGRGPTMLGTEGQGLIDVEFAGPEAKIVEEPAPEWLVERSKQTPFHLVAIGPLSNVAASLRLDPAFAGRLSGLTVMGGVLDDASFPPAWRQAIRERALDAATFDHNTASDPTAALICARSGLPLTWVPTEVTLHAPLRRASRDLLAGISGEPGAALVRMLDVWHARWLRSTLPSSAASAQEGTADVVAYLHDPLTLASVFHGDWLRLRRVTLTYDVSRGLFHLLEATPSDPGEGAATVAVAVDGPAFERFCVGRIVRFLAGAARERARPNPSG